MIIIRQISGDIKGVLGCIIQHLSVIFPLNLDKDSLFVILCVQWFEMGVDTSGRRKGQNTKKPYIEDEHTMQWSNEKAQKDKQ